MHCIWKSLHLASVNRMISLDLPHFLEANILRWPFVSFALNLFTLQHLMTYDSHSEELFFQNKVAYMIYNIQGPWVYRAPTSCWRPFRPLDLVIVIFFFYAGLIRKPGFELKILNILLQASLMQYLVEDSGFLCKPDWGLVDSPPDTADMWHRGMDQRIYVNKWNKIDDDKNMHS